MVTKIDYLIITIIIFLLSFIGAIFWNYLIKRIKAYYTSKKFKIGKKGEVKAKEYLLARGYKILAEQPIINAQIYIDNKEYSYDVRADYIIKKRGKKAVVEVKTGEDATNPLSTNTRRQLFEYSHLYNIDKLFLFDAETMKLREISFTPNKNKIDILFIIFIFIIGLIILFLPYILRIIKTALF